METHSKLYLIKVAWAYLVEVIDCCTRALCHCHIFFVRLVKAREQGLLSGAVGLPAYLETVPPSTGRSMPSHQVRPFPLL